MQQPTTQRWTRTNLTNGRAYDPYQHADEMGIQVLFRPIRAANEMWLPDHHTIVIKDGMRAVHRRTACAHGIAHALYGHEDDRPKHEVQADRYAAERLIDRLELEDVMRWAPDPARIAQELGVTGRLLRVYLNVHRLAS